jgi:hypothetical protein
MYSALCTLHDELKRHAKMLSEKTQQTNVEKFAGMCRNVETGKLLRAIKPKMTLAKTSTSS